MSRFFKNIRIFRRSTPGMKVSGVWTPAGSGAVDVRSADRALQLATVYRCVELISNSVAMLPLVHQRRQAGTYVPVDDDLSHFLSVEPNEWTSAFDFWKQAVQQRLLFGDGLIVPQFDTLGGLKRLVLARPHTGGPAAGIGRYIIEDPQQGLSGEYLEDEVIRVKGLTLDGVRCLSVISYAASTASIAATADKNTLNTFANGGATMGMVSNESGVPGYGEYQLEALQGLADRMSEHIKRGDRILAVSGKASYTPFSMTAADMQFLESRKFTVLEICRFFGVHPSMVFGETASNYKSAEMANVAFLSNCLAPILRQIEIEIARKLLPCGSAERVRFDREELYATDLEGRMAYIEKRIGTGTYTPNEARRSLGMLPVEGGDAVMLSANLKKINEFDSNEEN